MAFAPVVPGNLLGRTGASYSDIRGFSTFHGGQRLPLASACCRQRRAAAAAPTATAAPAEGTISGATPRQQAHLPGPATQGGQQHTGTGSRNSSGGQRPHAAPQESVGGRRPYPHIDQRHPGLVRVHAEPPVYIARRFLSAEDCRLLRASAEAGELQHLEYDNAVLLDMHRLWPLLVVVAAGAGIDTWHALAAAQAAAAVGSEAGAASAMVDAAAVLAAAAGPAVLRWGGAVGGLLAAVMLCMRSLVGGKVFTGTKWTAARLDPAHCTAPVLSRFLARTCALLGTGPSQLEPPTVTRYRVGQYQRIHFDARPEGDPEGLQQFLEAGGQRLVQVVVYLNSLTPDHGGGTHFYHPLLAGLTIQPQQGDALVFFPAFGDGRFDERMAHGGQAVRAGEKWILNTWACQRAVPTALHNLPLPAPVPADDAPVRH